MKEVWKDTKGVFGYQVSNFGRVRSIFSRWGETSVSKDNERLYRFSWICSGNN